MTILSVCLMATASMRAGGTNEDAGAIAAVAQENAGAVAHFSIDDVLEPLQDITVNREKYASIFENDFFAFLKELHDEYGICVTCNLFYRSHPEFTLADVTDAFKDEFQANASWLRFSWHGRNGFERYTDPSLNGEAVASYEAVNGEICRFAGKESLSTFIRPSFFSGNKALWALFAATEYGLEGIYGADDEREANAGLDAEERKEINTNYEYTDPESGIRYVKSFVRFDGKSAGQGRTIVEQVYNSGKPLSLYGIFMHQQSITPLDANACEACREAVRFLREKGVAFSFPKK